ncbi:Mycothiol acetyltransferase [Arthrobacter sp. SO5]|uniref:GNAT family N-acetyltransferase n=1 Tax=Arthrobacter sp. SO5 TaxID=1897055 RepID=UPI001E3198DC|nr:GNAT family N-acetyltransferase [Arthrobacter sp. SO5]MCB5275279.1 Mycothiol acetyltransferase [Arthrobacter sp. SO5]
MNAMVTLAAPTGPQDRRAATIEVRPLEALDLPELTVLYRRAYADGAYDPGEGAAGGIGALLQGVHGSPVPDATLVSVDAGGNITAAIITTDSAVAAEASGAAIIAELFTHPDHRRQGLAEELLLRCIHALHAAGRTSVTVRVDSSNAAAMALYLSRDFRRLPDDDSD